MSAYKCVRAWDANIHEPPLSNYWLILVQVLLLHLNFP